MYSGEANGARQALLPAGLQDVLYPDAANEAAIVEKLIRHVSRHGYERVKPPLIEFEDSLLAGPGGQVSDQTFRLMDPISQRMMGLRADMTPQVARVAISRLAQEPRPLRLCYAGEVLRVRGSQLRPERQFTQVGVELIGSSASRADAEAVFLAADALLALGVEELSVDLSLPTLVGRVFEALELPDSMQQDLRAALDRKDSAAVQQSAGTHAALFDGLLRASGLAEEALERIEKLPLPAAVRGEVERLVQVIGEVRAMNPGLVMTVDCVDHRGFEYQTGLSFTLFASGVRGELGRGGRYDAPRGEVEGEPAIGFTLFMDSVLRALPGPSQGRRLFLPVDADGAAATAYRAAGWVTVAALDDRIDPRSEALRLNCTHILVGNKIEELED
ncbi:ATP phosphoribosyltransferase regulatory subunit [Fodinicurvata fenggangensis]|uniref:ATP phosphoribosyltransferase regulatory subunit n=1 Tax=Fodinicurvata fenggangensis TaxID=1121830 RepID=UPI00054E8954|nr:ATP phosphoribosyltransferase regulatory subunit [Fodinicurvata fenggangensis]